MTDALQSAHAIDPDNPTVADWWGEELDKRKQYTTALSVYQRSSNTHTQQRVAQMYETGIGTAIDLPTALLWYKRSANQQLLADNSGIPTYYRSGSMAHIYRLVCQQKIAASAASPEFQQLEYDAYFQETLTHQAVRKLKTNPCIPIPGG
ncbi:SEL1-like repeat protein [Chamaesiphon sp.]|uniref:SEL1-like repeat protein n=1 Tax=Chamaesiphon sp. TaxID=2814140 RepID=UPI00359325D8